MQGMVRITYALGWLFFIFAIIGRVLLRTSMAERMIAFDVLPRNFIQLSFLFFIIAIASYCGARLSRP